MNTAHLHLLLTHVPVIGTIFGLLVLAVGLMRRNTVLVKTSLVVFVVSGLAAGATYLTGEGAEEVVEHMAGTSGFALSSHENAGFYALVAAALLGLFALGGLVFYRDRLPRTYALTVVLLAIAVGGVMTWTANLGGQIRRPELRSGTITQQLDPAMDQARSAESRQDQDESDEDEE